jgi:hypothetical protein
LEDALENPFRDASRSHRFFDVLAHADRPLRPEEIAGTAGEAGAMAAHSMLTQLRARGVPVYRYRDPNGSSPAASVYSLRPTEGFVELASITRHRAPHPSQGPPAPVRPGVRQPMVGSVARVTALMLEGDTLRARFECDGAVYGGTVGAAQPSVGEWFTLATVGLHGHGLYVDLAGARVVTIENITEVSDGG